MAEIKKVVNDDKERVYLSADRQELGNVPDKFWSDEHGLNLTAMLTSYADAEAGMRQAVDRAREQITQERQAQIPAEYKANFPEVDGLKPEELMPEPVISALKKGATEAQLTQDQMDAVIRALATDAANGYQTADQRLREQLGENHKERWDLVTGKLASKLGEQMNGFESTLKNPNVFKVIEELVTTTPGTPSSSGTTAAPAITQEDLDAMQQDPRYWDPYKRDPNFVAKVTRAYQQLYGEEELEIPDNG